MRKIYWTAFLEVNQAIAETELMGIPGLPRNKVLEFWYRRQAFLVRKLRLTPVPVTPCATH